MFQLLKRQLECASFVISFESIIDNKALSRVSSNSCQLNMEYFSYMSGLCSLYFDLYSFLL